MKSISSWVWALVAVLLCQIAGLAMAQQPSQSQVNAIKQSCRSDYQSYCSSVPTGGSAALQCLQQNLSSLSPPCQTAVNAASGGGGASHPQGSTAHAMPPAGAPSAMSPREEAALMRRSCSGDFRAYCRGVPLGGGHGLACLAENESRLSPSCKGALAEARAAR
jgi:hypothetical protein